MKKDKEPNLSRNPQMPIGINLSPQDLVSDVSSQEEALAKVSVLLADETRKKMISELPDEEQVKNVAVLLAIAKKYNVPFINDVIDNYLLLQISQKRKGRKEIVDMIKGNSDRVSEGLRGKLRRLLPMGGYD